MKFTRAIVRTPADTLVKGLTTSDLGKPDYEKARIQHLAYIDALRELGLEVMMLPMDDRFPDSVFVEDTAVITPEFGIITRPGAVTRRDEIVEMEGVMRRFFLDVELIESPGTVDGGDVLQAGNRFYVGISKRTNANGAGQLAEKLKKHGFEVIILPVEKSLHLKSDVAWLGNDTLIVTPAFANQPDFADYKKIVTPEEERYAANCVMINGVVLVAEGFPATRELIEKEGYKTKALDVSEFRKLDGGLSCLSLRF
jgi:dimethylargininase